MRKKKKKVTWVEEPKGVIADAVQPNVSRDDGTPKRGKHWKSETVLKSEEVEEPDWALFDLEAAPRMHEMLKEAEDAPVSGGLPVYPPPPERKVKLPSSLTRIDSSMIGKILRLMVKNETARTWYADMCYPGAYWRRDGRRIPEPATKAQLLDHDVGPGEVVSFGIVVPRLPREKPHELVIAVLENGIMWHEVKRIAFG